MQKRVLFIGGWHEPYHLFEECLPAVSAAAEELGFALTATRDREAISQEGLAGVDLLMLQTTGGELRPEQVQAVLDLVHSGGALVGIHGAADSFRKNREYIALLGGEFRTHPHKQELRIEIVDKAHPITAGLEPFTIVDELYILNYDPARVHILCETTSYENTAQPVAWTREEGQGRVFYTSLGHHLPAFETPGFRRLLTNGTKWALGSV